MGKYYHAERFTDASKDGTCPKCGGSSFKVASRRIFRNALLGPGSALAAATSNGGKVQCVTCGEYYQQG
jgi:predicted  nucleic acid-binding Zn-ribbon protein